MPIRSLDRQTVVKMLCDTIAHCNLNLLADMIHVATPNTPRPHPIECEDKRKTLLTSLRSWAVENVVLIDLWDVIHPKSRNTHWDLRTNKLVYEYGAKMTDAEMERDYGQRAMQGLPETTKSSEAQSMRRSIPKNVCMTEECDSPRKWRGLCDSCYAQAKTLIDRRETTWAELSDMGLVLQPFRAAFIRKKSEMALQSQQDREFNRQREQDMQNLANENS